MSGGDFIVPARSWASIAAQAKLVRQGFGLSDTPFLPIIPLLEALPDIMPPFQFRVDDDANMVGVLGVTAPDGSYIALSESVYRRACENSPRDRFTAAHELGHLFLHRGTNGAVFQRVSDSRASVLVYKRSEPQANLFAAVILMPQKFIQLGDDPADLMETFGVSYEAATNRLETLAKKGI